MKNLLRRKTDEREVWSESDRDEKTSLIIPPCDLWHDMGAIEEPSSPIEQNETSEMLVDDVPEENNTEAKKINYSTTQCWAFMGATGGVGTTSLAVQFAYELTKQISQFGRGVHNSSGPLVCLIDLDFEAGRVAQYLDISPGISHEDLLKEAVQIDAAYAQALFVEHKSGMSVLAAPNKLGANREINPATVISLLEIACEMFPYVILDVPQHWQTWNLAALGGSDFVGLVSDLSIPSLNAAREKRAQIAQLFDNEKSCEFVLNKFERRYMKSSIKLPDAKKALKSDIFGSVCLEGEVALEAINCGAPIGLVRPSSRIAKDCETLIDKIQAMTLEESMSDLGIMTGT